MSQEALAFGLANRVVGNGEARAAAEALAAEIARFPQACLRGDRRSAHEGLGLSMQDAMANEFAIGLRSLREARRGAERFSAGHGRHGDFGDL